MSPDRSTKKEGLREVLLHIRQACLQVANRRKRYFFFSYERLAEVSHATPEDWMCDGWIRNTLMGRDARRWLYQEYDLWWKADEEEHLGLLFTCDPITGVDWDRTREAASFHAGAVYLRDSACYGEHLRPSNRPHFRKVKDTANRVAAGAKKLKELGDAERLRLLGVGGEDK